MMGPSRATDYLYCEVRARLLHAFAETAPQFRLPPLTERERRFQAAGINIRPTQEWPPHQLGQDIWVCDILFSLSLFIRFVWYEREGAFSVDKDCHTHRQPSAYRSCHWAAVAFRLPPCDYPRYPACSCSWPAMCHWHS